MCGEKWRHLLHVGHAADGPVADVLVKDRRPIEHEPVRRHAPHGISKKGRGRKEGHSVRSQYTAVLCCAEALASGSCADAISGMAGPYGCGDGVAHSGAYSDGDSGHLTSEDRDGGQMTATRYGG